MGIILKYTLKNIIKKPFRTIMVTVCVMFCVLAAMFAFDMSNSLKNLFAGIYGSFFGNADIIITATDISNEIYEDESLKDARILSICAGSSEFYKRVDGEYTYMTEDSLTIYSLDIPTAKEMGVVVYDITLADDELILSSDFAEKYGYEEGDEIILHDYDDEEEIFKVAKIHDYNGRGFMATDSAVINLSAIEKFYNGRNPKTAIVEIEFLGKENVRKVTNDLKEKYPYLTIESVTDNEEVEEAIGQMQNLFLLLFAFCLLMVLFVTISVSERIVTERMAVVGTLRSLGISSSITTMSLLLENATYGLVGGIIGCYIYSGLRDVVLGSFLNTDSLGDMNVDITFGSVSIFMYILIILGAIIIECLCPLAAVIKAVKTPIRDIIFANKDTEYEMNNKSVLAGIVLAVIAVIGGIVSIFIKSNFILSLTIIVSIIFALSLLFPCALRFVAGLLEKLFDKCNMPIARLASTMIRTKKSTVGSNVLIATAVAIAVVIFAVSGSLLSLLNTEEFGSDIIVDSLGYKDENYFSYIRHLDGVDNISFGYYTIDEILLEEEEIKLQTFYGVNNENIGNITGFVNAPETFDKDKIYMDEVFARKHDLKVGDQVNITFDNDGYFPLTKTLTVGEFVDVYAVDSSRGALLIDLDLYKEIYRDKPLYIFVNCTDSANVEDVKALVQKYSKKDITEVLTRQESYDRMIEEGSGVIGVLNFVIYFGVGLTFVGSVSNLLIGFEGRKREFAVLSSTAVSKGKLRRMIFLESMFSSFISLIVAVPVGIILVNPVDKAFDAINAGVTIITTPGDYFGFAFALWIVFTLTALFPINSLNKMKIAEQLKYE